MNVIERGVRGLFAREFLTRQRKVHYPKFSTVVNSDKREEKYNMISTLPQLERLRDERVLAGFSEYSYTLENVPYATGIKIPRTLFEFDQTGQLRTLVGSMGGRVANFPDKLMFALLKNGDQAGYTGYDASVFFTTTHDLGDGTKQLNKITGKVTDALLDAASGSGAKTDRDNVIAGLQIDLMRAKKALFDLKDDRGEPWHDELAPEGLIAVCSPQLEPFLRIVLEGVIIQETSNPLVKSVGQVICTNYPLDVGAYDSSWYLLKVDTPIQPFIFQRFGPKTTFQDDIPEADQGTLQALSAVEIQTVLRAGTNIDAWSFFNDEFLIGARVIYSAGFGMWQNAIKIQGSAA
jgi:phage major head subunit gpT-like protein